MRERAKMLLVVAAVAATALVVGVVVVVQRLGSEGGPDSSESFRPPADLKRKRVEDVPQPASAPPARNKYDRAIDEAHRLGMRVWLEVEMIGPWQKGGQAFDEAIAEVAEQAKRPGVVGIKYTDEVGWDDPLKSPEEIRKFLRETSRALRKAAPGKLLNVDMFVPELGCLPGRSVGGSCRDEYRSQYPLLRVERAESYLLSGWVDVVNLSPDLFLDKYKDMGVTADEAQQAHWDEVKRRGWGDRIILYARDAEFGRNKKYKKDRTTAEKWVHTRIDLAHEGGAEVVTLWTWRQDWDGEYRRLMDPGLKENPLWEVLVERRKAGAHMATQFNPADLEVGLNQDMKMMSEAFTEVFMWTGVE